MLDNFQARRGSKFVFFTLLYFVVVVVIIFCSFLYANYVSTMLEHLQTSSGEGSLFRAIVELKIYRFNPEFCICFHMHMKITQPKESF